MPSTPWVSTGFDWVLMGLALLSLGLAARWLPWFKLRRDNEAQHVYFAGIVCLVALRFAVFDKIPGLSQHFFGAAIATLMYGPAFALWAMAFSVGVAALAGAGVWLGMAADFVTGGLLPVAWMQCQHWLIRRRLPNNVFVYVFATAFLGGALSVLIAQLARAATVAWMVDGASAQAAHNFLISAPLMMFGEAFFTGGAMALMVAYRPQWVASFDDDVYLKPPADE